MQPKCSQSAAGIVRVGFDFMNQKGLVLYFILDKHNIKHMQTSVIEKIWHAYRYKIVCRWYNFIQD